MANSGKRKLRSDDRFRAFTIQVLLVFVAAILLVTVILDFVVLELSGRAMKSNVSNLIAANSRQIQLNINSYLERTETISTLLFSDEAYYLYDAMDPGLSEYDKIKREEAINNRIVDIGLMENYSDFGIVFSDDHKVGWISNSTQDLFPEGGIYEAFAAHITNARKKDGWCFGVHGNTDRIYYIKRLNANGILVSSIYTRELSSVFVYPEQLEDMTIRLVGDEDVILFSSDPSEIGTLLPETLRSDSKKEDPAYIINVNTCSNGWQVICSIPTDSVLRENHRLQGITLLISAGVVVLALLIGLLLITRMSKPVEGIVTSLKEKAEIDRLSGVMNKGTFQEMTEERLARQGTNQTHVFVMLDVDNFKQVNDNLGHAYGDQVIIRVGQLLRRLYDRETIIGRLGGDEFALYTQCVDIDPKEVIRAVEEQMDYVLEEFGKEFEKERESSDISLSAGIHVVSGTAVTFKELYEAADAALYKSKQNGKARYTLTEGGVS